ncbi:hypothetical protein ACSFB8_07585 [Enterococcus faecalis]
MTTKHLYVIYTAITLVTSVACILSGTFVVGLLLYGVWVGSSILWRRISNGRKTTNNDHK